MDYDVEIEPARDSAISLTLRIDTEVANGWRTAARRNGLSLTEWISLSLNLADRLCLVDGYERTPSVGRRLDPLLARAIMEAAQGKEWEHRAMLLLGMANPMPEGVGLIQGRKRGRIPVQLSELFTQYGVPFVEVAPNYYAVLGDKVLSWQELAYVLTLWNETQFDWAYLSNKGLQERTGMNMRDVQKATERAITQELVEREPLADRARSRRTQNRTRVTRRTGEALLRGALRAAGVDDSYSEAFLTTQSQVSVRNGSGEHVDPLLLEAAREAQIRGQSTATEVLKGYLAALDHSTT